MKKVLAIALTATALTACFPEKDSSPEITYKITNDNGVQSLSAVSIATEDSMDFGSLDAIEQRTYGKSLIQAKATESETVSCSSGSLTLSITADDDLFSGNDLPASGSLGMSFDYDDCSYGSETMDGSVSTDFSWSGYDGYDFASMVAKITFDKLSTTGTDGTYKMHGDMEMSMTTSNMTLEWDFYVTAPELGNQTIRTRTTSAIVQGIDDYYPTSGSFRVEGADDTYVEATVVANGYEVVINGGQAELYTWSELDFL